VKVERFVLEKESLNPTGRNHTINIHHVRKDIEDKVDNRNRWEPIFNLIPEDLIQ